MCGRGEGARIMGADVRGSVPCACRFTTIGSQAGQVPKRARYARRSPRAREQGSAAPVAHLRAASPETPQAAPTSANEAPALRAARTAWTGDLPASAAASSRSSRAVQGPSTPTGSEISHARGAVARAAPPRPTIVRRRAARRRGHPRMPGAPSTHPPRSHAASHADRAASAAVAGWTPPRMRRRSAARMAARWVITPRRTRGFWTRSRTCCSHRRHVRPCRCHGPRCRCR